MQRKIRKILIIISILILIIGVVSGIGIKNELIDFVSNSNVSVDGSNFSGIVELTGVIGSQILGTLIIFGSVVLDIVIWIVYGLVILILNFINYIKTKKDRKLENE